MNTNRRDFILKTAALAGLAVLPSWAMADAKGSGKQNIGVQLYTLRSVLENEPKRVLQALAKQGYKELEGYGGASGKYFGLSAGEFTAICKDLGLSVKSWHVSGGWAEERKGNTEDRTMLNRWPELLEELKAMGAAYVVVPYIAKEDRADLASYNRIAEQFNTAAEMASKIGLQFCYHNHEFEFEEMEGTTPYEVLLRNTNEKLVQFELDLYWATRAKVSPIELFRQHAGRFPLWHVKDMHPDTKAFAEVGTGAIDFKSIFRMAETAGMQHFFVEQDKCPGDPLASTGISIKNLKESILK